MKKIRLNADDLNVLSFATSQGPQGRGTVLAAGTGYECYVTVAYDEDTICLAYAPSHWGEDTCRCEPVRVTDPSYCLHPINTAGLTCMTCPGIHPGC